MPIIGRCRLSNGRYRLSADWPIIGRYRLSADNRCTSSLNNVKPGEMSTLMFSWPRHVLLHGLDWQWRWSKTPPVCWLRWRPMPLLCQRARVSACYHQGVYYYYYYYYYLCSWFLWHCLPLMSVAGSRWRGSRSSSQRMATTSVSASVHGRQCNRSFQPSSSAARWLHQPRAQRPTQLQSSSSATAELLSPESRFVRLVW